MIASSLKLVGGIFLMAALSACAGSGDAPKDGVAGVNAAAASSMPDMSLTAGALTGTDWELVQWPGHALPSSGAEPVVLNFSQNGRASMVSGRAGCNRFSASYTLSAQDQISFGSPASTRMACASQLMQFESSFLKLLAAVSRIQVQAGGMQMFAADGQVLSYRPRANAAADVSKPVGPATEVTAAASPATAAADAAPATTQDLYVAPLRAKCMGIAPMQCLQVRQDPKGPWQLWYSPIEGFEFKTGTAYHIRINGWKIANPPADSSSMRWKLVQILEQHRAGPHRKKK
jgi:heat shock protein HslJ